MERRRLGPTGATVGCIGLGTSTWGRGTDRAEAAEQTRLLLDAGGDLIDVDLSGPGAAYAEEVLADAAVRRAILLHARSPARGSQRDLIADLDALIASVGHVDVWSVEGWSKDLPWEEVIGALTVAVSTGRARYAGITPTAAWHAALSGAALAAQPQRIPLACIAVPYSLLDRVDAEAAVDVAAALGASVIAAWPLAGGVLTGKYRNGTPPDSRGAGERHGARLQRYRGAGSRPTVDGLAAAADGLGCSPGSLALAWVLGRPGVAACLVGARTVHQWRTALAGAGAALPAEIGNALDEVSAGTATIGQDGKGAAFAAG